MEKRALDQKWFELQQAQVAFEKYFIGSKIVYPNVSFGPRFAIDDGSYLDMTSFGVNSAELWLLGVLNSSVTNFFFSKLGIERRGGYQEFKTQYVSQIPIPASAPEQQLEIEGRVEQILAQKKENPEADVSALEAEIDQLVYKLYDLTPEEIEIIEGKV